MACAATVMPREALITSPAWRSVPPHPYPQGWQAITIPPREYLVAWHAGHISAIRSTWLWLLNDYLPASGLTLADAPDLERYDARFDDRSGHGGVEIWLPLTDMLHLKETDPCE